MQDCDDLATVALAVFPDLADGGRFVVVAHVFSFKHFQVLPRLILEIAPLVTPNCVASCVWDSCSSSRSFLI
jgi:hypothetical protein